MKNVLLSIKRACAFALVFMLVLNLAFIGGVPAVAYADGTLLPTAKTLTATMTSSRYVNEAYTGPEDTEHPQYLYGFDYQVSINGVALTDGFSCGASADQLNNVTSPLLSTTVTFDTIVFSFEFNDPDTEGTDISKTAGISLNEPGTLYGNGADTYTPSASRVGCSGGTIEYLFSEDGTNYSLYTAGAYNPGILAADKTVHFAAVLKGTTSDTVYATATQSVTFKAPHISNPTLTSEKTLYNAANVTTGKATFSVRGDGLSSLFVKDYFTFTGVTAPESYVMTGSDKAKADLSFAGFSEGVTKVKISGRPPWIDACELTITVDKTAPSITFAPEGEIYSYFDEATKTYYINKSSETEFQYKYVISDNISGINSVNITRDVRGTISYPIWTDSTTLIAFPLGADGIYKSTANVTDNAGNNNSETATVIRDTTGPTVTIGTIPGSGTEGTDYFSNHAENENPATFTVTVTDSNLSTAKPVLTYKDSEEAQYEIPASAISDAVLGTGTATFTVTLPDGDYNGKILATATDKAGNSGTAIEAPIDIVVDSVGPVAVIMLEDGYSVSSSEGMANITVKSSIDANENKSYKGITATVTVVDKNFTSAPVVTYDGNEVDGLTKDDATGNYTVSVTLFAGGSSLPWDPGFSVTARDLSGNPLTGRIEGTGGSTHALSGALPESKTGKVHFTEKPVKSISINHPTPATVGDESWYNITNTAEFQVLVGDETDAADFVSLTWNLYDSSDPAKTLKTGTLNTAGGEIDLSGIFVNGGKLVVTGVDRIGNTRTVELSGLKIDTKAPEIKLEFDNNAVSNEKYYKANRTLTITVTEANQDNYSITAAITGGAELSSTPVVNEEDNTVKWTVPFTTEGKHSVANITYTDKAGNKVEAADIAEFIIDKTVPEITLDWGTDPAAVNEKYYKADRTLTITVTEANQDNDSFITAITGGATLSGPVVSGSTATWTIPFTTEGKHSVTSIAYTDKAGNTKTLGTAEDSAVAEFVIDKTAPVAYISIPDPQGSDTATTYSGKHYYATAQNIVFTVEDANFDANSTTVTITTDKAGTITPTFTEEKAPGIWTYTYTAENEKITALSLVTTDLGGNAQQEDTTDNISSYAGLDFIVDNTAPVVSMTVSAVTVKDDGTEEDLDVTNCAYINDKAYIKLDPSEKNTTEDKSTTTKVTVTLTLTDDYFTSAGAAPAGWTRSTNSETPNVYTITKTATVNKRGLAKIELGTAAKPVILKDVVGNCAATVSFGLTNDETDTTLTEDQLGYDSTKGELICTLNFDKQVPGYNTNVDPAPFISISHSFEEPTKEYTKENAPSVFTGGLTVTATAKDASDVPDDPTTDAINESLYNSGIKTLDWAILGDEDISDNGAVTETDAQGYHTANVEITPEAEYEKNGLYVQFTATDYAGNVTVVTYPFGIDTATPKVTLTMDPQEEDIYYKVTRTATIKVTELNQNVDSAGAVKNTITLPQNNSVVAGHAAPVLTGPTVAGNTVTWTIEYADDGTYSIGTISYTDRYGHTGTCEGAAEFVIDKTLPVVNVSFDNNNVLNGKYYKAGRTATITVTELNRDDSNGIAATVSNNTHLNGPNGAGDKFSYTVPCTADGIYSITGITYTDKAGNSTHAPDVSEFVVDLTAPTVAITGVADHSANKGAVAPIVTFNDTNFSLQGCSVFTSFQKGLTGGVNVNLANSVVTTGTGAVYTFNDIASVVGNDGIYTMTANIEDLAGNTGTATITYSVNRFGSTYYTDDPATQALLSGRFSREPVTLKIYEINPDKVTNQSVSINHNGASLKLDSKSYSVKNVSNAKNDWSEYLYTIDVAAFKENDVLREGAYTVMLYSKDAAGNENSNRTNQNSLEAEFVLDATAPIVTISGIADGDAIRATNRNVTVYFEDSFSVSKVRILLNGKEIKVLEGKELAEARGEYSFVLDEMASDQSIEVIVEDAAGNVNNDASATFFLNANRWQQFVHNTGLFYGTIGGVLVVGGGAAYYFLSKRKKTTVPEGESSKEESK